MTAAILLRTRHLRCRHLQRRQIEMRVITEAARTGGIGLDLAFPVGLGDQRAGVLGMTQEDDAGVLARRPRLG